MTYRPHRRTLTSTIRVGKHLCKVFIKPWDKMLAVQSWKVGFGVGKSRRQINDWYHVNKIDAEDLYTNI